MTEIINGFDRLQQWTAVLITVRLSLGSVTINLQASNCITFLRANNAPFQHVNCESGWEDICHG